MYHTCPIHEPGKQCTRDVQALCRMADMGKTFPKTPICPAVLTLAAPSQGVTAAGLAMMPQQRPRQLPSLSFHSGHVGTEPEDGDGSEPA